MFPSHAAFLNKLEPGSKNRLNFAEVRQMLRNLTNEFKNESSREAYIISLYLAKNARERLKDYQNSLKISIFHYSDSKDLSTLVRGAEEEGVNVFPRITYFDIRWSVYFFENIRTING